MNQLKISLWSWWNEWETESQASVPKYGLANTDQSFVGTHSLHLKGIKMSQQYRNSADTGKWMTRSTALGQPTVSVVNQHLFEGGLHYYTTRALYILEVPFSEFSDITYGLGFSLWSWWNKWETESQPSVPKYGLANTCQSFHGTHSLHLKGIKISQQYRNSADTGKWMTRSKALSQPTVSVVNQQFFKGGITILPDSTSNTIGTCGPKCDLPFYQNNEGTLMLQNDVFSFRHAHNDLAMHTTICLTTVHFSTVNVNSR